MGTLDQAGWSVGRSAKLISHQVQRSARLLIHHIVVNERGRVDHFSDLSQAAVAGRELSLRGQSPRQKQNDAGAQPLAAGTEQMLGSGLGYGVTCPDQAAQVSEQGFKICLYRLE